MNSRISSVRDQFASHHACERLSPNGLSILIVDDHALVRAGMRRLLEDATPVRNFDEAASGEQALRAASAHRYDVIFMDLTLPGIGGVETILSMLRKRPEELIIVITAAMQMTCTRQLLDAGVRGYLTKDCTPAQMERAIADVMAGKTYLTPEVSQQLALQTANEGQQRFDALSKRELEIIMLIARGMNNRQIGEHLFISEKTVSTHRRSSFEKLGVGNSAELARLAIQLGLWDSLGTVEITPLTV